MDTENQRLDVGLSHSEKEQVCLETGEAWIWHDCRKELS